MKIRYALNPAYDKRYGLKTEKDQSATDEGSETKSTRKAVTLFAKEDWYQKQPGKVQEFEGELQKVVRAGVGFGRSNPYRLKMDRDSREVYVGGKRKLLDDYVGQRILLRGKAVDMRVEGRVHREIWPADVVALGVYKQVSFIDGGATMSTTSALRSHKEFQKALGLVAEATGRRLGKIDFKKQMLVLVKAGKMNAFGVRVAINRLETSKDGKSVIIHWTFRPYLGGARPPRRLGNPGAIAVVDRFDGVVKFQKRRLSPTAGDSGASVGSSRPTASFQIAGSHSPVGRLSCKTTDHSVSFRRSLLVLFVFAGASFVLNVDASFAQAKQTKQRPKRRPRPKPPKPDHANLAYGKHRRQVLDLWLAKSERPTPLVIYIHGGGFRGGSKDTVSPGAIQGFRRHGVSVAAINYRLTTEVPFPAAHHDSARAIQFLRHHAKKYNLDPKRFAATGGSAGGGISMWLAFHDDLADPKSDDPIARESTRLTCVAVSAAQSSYDPRFAKSIGLPRLESHGFFFPFYGIKRSEFDSPKAHKLYEEASAITHLTKDDAPVYAAYGGGDVPITDETSVGVIVHHPKFGIVLKERMDKLGIECIVRYRGQKEPPRESSIAFLLRHLKVNVRRRQKRRTQ